MTERRLRASLDAVPAYRQGKAPASGAVDVAKLSSNENPYPPLPSVVAATAAHLATMNRYPTTAAPALTDALTSRFGIGAENLVFGAGSVESVSQLIRATSGEGDEVMFAWRSFEAYPMLVRTAGAIPVEVLLDAEHRHDLDAMLAAITDRTRLIMICNPNNPTGTTLSHEQVDAFISSAPSDVVILIDEAYIHFNDRADTAIGMDLFRAHPNVVVTHTFSKAYGLAGMRVGYAIAPAEIASAMRKVAVPFGVTALAQAAAVASLEAEAELQERVDILVSERERVVASMTELGWNVPESRANFVWLPLADDTERVSQAWESAGILARAFPGEGMRVSLGDSAANDRVIEAASHVAAAGHDAALRN